MANGFGKKAPQTPLLCEARVVNTPSSQQKMTIYRGNKKVYSDLDELLNIYQTNLTEAEVAKFKIRLIKPIGAHPELQSIRGIPAEQVTKVMRIAEEKGTPEGRMRAAQDSRALIKEGMQQSGIDNAVITDDGRLVPITKDGQPIEKYSFQLSDGYESTLMVLNNHHPFFATGNKRFYKEVLLIAKRRIDSLTNNHEIAAYLGALLGGMAERQPELDDTGYIEALFSSLLYKFSEDRKQLVIHLMGNGSQTPEYLLEDLLAAVGRVAEDTVIAPGKSERLISKQDLRALDPFWMGAHRLSDMADALEKAEHEHFGDG